MPAPTREQVSFVRPPVDAAEHLAGARPETRELIAQLIGQRDPGAHQTLARLVIDGSALV